MRAAVYARYSTDLQSASSIEDQVRLCREHIEKNRWTLVVTYSDRAVSGASHLRPGYQQLISDARLRQFDVVVAEALDRISRDQEHVAAFYKQLSFCDVKIFTLAEGEITELHVGLKGTMNALFLRDLADKTRRGLRGRVEAGRSGGGICFGYDLARETRADEEQGRGKRSINDAEANIVRQIFREFAVGKSPRGIAKELNAHCIMGPTDKAWTASTIHGNTQRGTGILNNELYIGRLVWNRLRYSKDPATGKRISRHNPKKAWIIIDVPELRIVDQQLWEEVKKRQAELALTDRSQKIRNALNMRHRARYLLSGLLICGTCGAGYTLVGGDRYACANHVNRGTCTNSRTVLRRVIELRVLSGIKEKLLAPDLIEVFVREFAAEWNRQVDESRQSHIAIDAELKSVEHRISLVMAAIEQGIITQTTKERLLELEAMRDRLKITLTKAKERTRPPALHPNIAEIYRRKVADLETALSDPSLRGEAALAIRNLVDAVVLNPGAKRGEVLAELHGELAALLNLNPESKTRTSRDVRVSLVAGERNHLYRTVLVLRRQRSHGSSTGSNPVGDANKFNSLHQRPHFLPQLFPNKRAVVVGTRRSE
jgi:DNA invertase Pin-like site-specific DNA recombinase